MYSVVCKSPCTTKSTCLPCLRFWVQSPHRKIKKAAWAIGRVRGLGGEYPLCSLLTKGLESMWRGQLARDNTDSFSFGVRWKMGLE